MKRKFTDREMIERILIGNDDEVLKVLYEEKWPPIKRYIMKNSGSEDDAQDVFQDAILAFYKHVKQGKFREDHEIGAFLYTIARNLWINKARKSQRHTGLSDHHWEISEDADVLSGMMDEERSELVMEIFSMIGEKCRELLTYSIFYGYSMREICERMGFSTENAAKTRNYKCKQKLIRIVDDHQHLKSMLR